MKSSISWYLFISCLMVLTPVYAGTQTLTTYYPAPQGNYNNMTVNNTLTIPVTSSICTAPGNGVNSALCLANEAGLLQICDKTGCEQLQSGGLWNSVGNPPSFMYPANNNEDVCIGNNCSTAVPGTSLDVLGSTSITGSMTSATAAITGAATVGSTLAVTGATTLGSTLAVTGATTMRAVTVSSTLAVTGATTLNGGAVISGGASINGSTYANASSGIWLCTNTSTNPPSGCGQLMLAQSGGSYYAAYAP